MRVFIVALFFAFFGVCLAQTGNYTQTFVSPNTLYCQQAFDTHIMVDQQNETVSFQPSDVYLYQAASGSIYRSQFTVEYVTSDTTYQCAGKLSDAAFTMNCPGFGCDYQYDCDTNCGPFSSVILNSASSFSLSVVAVLAAVFLSVF